MRRSPTNLWVVSNVEGESEFASARDALRVSKLDAQQEAAELRIRHQQNNSGALAAEWTATQVADRASQSQREREITAEITPGCRKRRGANAEEFERLMVERESSVTRTGYRAGKPLVPSRPHLPQPSCKRRI